MPFSLRLPKDLKDFLRRRAEEDNRKLAPLIVVILEEWRKAYHARRKAENPPKAGKEKQQ